MARMMPPSRSSSRDDRITTPPSNATPGTTGDRAIGPDAPLTPPSPSTPTSSADTAGPVVATGPALPATSPDPADTPQATEPADGAGPARPDAAATPEGSTSSALFGRGMLYVVVASLQIVTGAVASPVLAHLLGDPAEFGRLSSSIALHQLLVVVALIGLDQATVLRRAEDGHDGNARSLASTAMLLVTGVTALLWLTSTWWSAWFGFDPGSQLVLLTVLWTIPSAGIIVQLALLLAADRLKAYATVSIVGAVGGQIVGITAVLLAGREATTYAWGLVAADTVAMLIGVTLARPSLRRAFSWDLVKPSLMLGAPLMFTGLSLFVLNAGDRIVVLRIAGAAEVGRYQVAYVVGFVAVQMIGLTGSSWTPRFAAVRDRVLRWQIIGASRDSIFGLLGPVVLGIILAAPVLLRIVAPASFQPESLLIVTYLVLISAYPVAASGASSKILVTSRRARPLALWATVAAVLNVALNFALVPTFGIAGAAGATVIAYSVQAFGLHWSVGHRHDWPRTPPRILGQAGLVILISAGTTLLPQSTPWNIARLVLAIACLPWCWIQLQRTRRGD